MSCGFLSTNVNFPFNFASSLGYSGLQKNQRLVFSVIRIKCASSAPNSPTAAGAAQFLRPEKKFVRIEVSLVVETLGLRLSPRDKLQDDVILTGGAYDFEKATTSLTRQHLSCPKKVTLVRHGLSTWNEEGRVQGSSNQSVLTDTGIKQAERCREALTNIKFDKCFSSPISRAKSTAEVMWQGKEEPLVFLDSLKEAHLYFLEGVKNGLSSLPYDSFLVFSRSARALPVYDDSERPISMAGSSAVEAKEKYPVEYTAWREDPANFNVNGVYPIRQLWETAKEAWREILLTPGECFLIVTHKSILRALICTALGLGPERFRAIEVNNGGMSVFSFNERGEAMLQSLNMTAHMYSDYKYIF